MASPSSSPLLLVQRLAPGAVAPRKSTPEAAGYDLFSPESFVLGVSQRRLVPLGLAVRVPEGTYGRIAGRSGLALRGLTVLGGVVDRDYAGNLGVILINLSSTPYEVQQGDRIAQLVLEKIQDADVLCVDALPADRPTLRDSRGFGSSGQ